MDKNSISEEFEELISEWCPHCGNEPLISRNKPTPCSFCGEILLPCSMCDLHHICSADTCPY